VACVTPSILGEPCPALLFSPMSVDRIGGDHGGKGLQEEHGGAPVVVVDY
jgi:hypothetical protein